MTCFLFALVMGGQERNGTFLQITLRLWDFNTVFFGFMPDGKAVLCGHCCGKLSAKGVAEC